ncbi:hypothetical protein [Castellaniella sp.]|uniref:hypothetical protein n=1 Tax=Castellaniella sp. TaxID=1955812 RepID=UPI0025BDE336|nr:hypothetical protein [Castellaniella sp.]
MRTFPASYDQVSHQPPLKCRGADEYDPLPVPVLSKKFGVWGIEFVNADVAQPAEKSCVFHRIFSAALHFNPPDGAVVLDQYVGDFTPNAILPAEPKPLGYFSFSGYAIALHNGTDCDLIGNTPVPIVGATECSDQILAADGVDPPGL